jgi:hypothetical protein
MKGGGPVLRVLAVLGVGYVLGSKAGRERYEQIAGTYRALTQSPAAKSLIDAGRRKVAEKVSPDPTMVELTEIDGQTVILEPVADQDAPADDSRRPRRK